MGQYTSMKSLNKRIHLSGEEGISLSLNAMHRNVMVFSDNKDKAIHKLNELVSGKEIIKRSVDYVETKEGTYQARKFNEGCRGYRYRDVYVDESLKSDQEALELIKFKLVPPHYYIGYERDDNYNPKDHVHFFK